MTPEQISYNMIYVLPTVPSVCSSTTLAKMNCQISTSLTTGTGVDVHEVLAWAEFGL